MKKDYLNTFVQIAVTFAFVAMLMRILVGCITCSVADRAVEMPKYFRKNINAGWFTDFCCPKQLQMLFTLQKSWFYCQSRLKKNLKMHL